MKSSKGAQERTEIDQAMLHKARRAGVQRQTRPLHRSEQNKVRNGKRTVYEAVDSRRVGDQFKRREASSMHVQSQKWGWNCLAFSEGKQATL